MSLFPSGNKCLLGGLLFVVVIYLLLDIHLYFCVQNGNMRPPKNETASRLCQISPFCHVTVKMIMLDHTNHYVHHPLAVAFNMVFNTPKNFPFITADMISLLHVFVGLVSARLLTNDSLSIRRMGVFLFMVRNFLDALDGVVARATKNIDTNISEVGSLGYFVDGICDGLGCIFVFVGCMLYLRSHPPRRGPYMPLALFEQKDSGQTKSHVSMGKIVRLVVCFAMQALLSSTAWNRYIALYQEALQKEAVTPRQSIIQEQVMKSAIMWFIFWLWRLLNVFNLLQLILTAVFFDKLWEFLMSVQYLGFVFLSSLISLSEMHVHDIQLYIQSAGSVDGEQ